MPESPLRATHKMAKLSHAIVRQTLLKASTEDNNTHTQAWEYIGNAKSFNCSAWSSGWRPELLSPRMSPQKFKDKIFILKIMIMIESRKAPVCVYVVYCSLQDSFGICVSCRVKMWMMMILSRRTRVFTAHQCAPTAPAGWKRTSEAGQQRKRKKVGDNFCSFC